ncbi:hypothetical protein NBRC116602_27510 [Hyphomicrobiales bacterium 4NK60-0047b]|jgi:hypothetical protein
MDKITILERPVEYEQALVNFRYFLDHKTKLFGFIIAINSILYPIILTTLQSQPTKVIASVMVVLLLVFAMIFDRRTTSQIKIFLKEAKRIERDLDFQMIQNTYPGRNAGGAFSLAYTAMYIIAIIFWCLHILIISKTFEAQAIIDFFTSLSQVPL